MPFKQFLNHVFVICLLLLLIIFYSCGIDELGKRAKEEEKKQTMDSLFKDADKVPAIEPTGFDSISKVN